MSNVYKRVFFAGTTTTGVSVYTCNATARAIIQNIQIANQSGSKVVKVSVSSSATATTYSTTIVAYASITGPTTCNLANGPIVLQENDVLYIDTSVASSVSGIVSILEVNRGTLTN
jgi:hypothetical protein